MQRAPDPHGETLLPAQSSPDKAKSQSFGSGPQLRPGGGTLIGPRWLLGAVAGGWQGGLECCALHKCDCDSAEQKQLLCHRARGSGWAGVGWGGGRRGWGVERRRCRMQTLLFLISPNLSQSVSSSFLQRNPHYSPLSLQTGGR